MPPRKARFGACLDRSRFRGRDTGGGQFHPMKYGRYAINHTHDNGLVFKDFRVPYFPSAAIAD